MAAEESSQGSPLGLEKSEPSGDELSADRDIPDLHDVLGEFLEALCVLEVVHRAFSALMEESSEHIGSYAKALEHSFEMLDAVYRRFDKALLAYEGPGGGDSDDDDGDDREASLTSDDRENRPDHGKDDATDAAADGHSSQTRRQRPNVHPGYKAAVEAQKVRVEDARSILDCVNHALENYPDEVEVMGAVSVAHKMLNDIVNGLDSVSLRTSAEKWDDDSVGGGGNNDTNEREKRRWQRTAY